MVASLVHRSKPTPLTLMMCKQHHMTGHTSNGTFTTYHPGSSVYAGHVKSPAEEVHTPFTYMWPYCPAAELIYEAMLICGRLYLYLAALRRSRTICRIRLWRMT